MRMPLSQISATRAFKAARHRLKIRPVFSGESTAVRRHRSSASNRSNRKSALTWIEWRCSECDAVSDLWHRSSRSHSGQESKGPGLQRKPLCGFVERTAIHACRIEHHLPDLAGFQAWQSESNWFVAAVQQQDEVVIDDWPPAVVVLVGGVAVQ